VLQGDVLAPFLFIIVIDYISKLSAGEHGYITHIGTQEPEVGERVRQTTQILTRQQRTNELTFADDMALLESTILRAQQQLDDNRREARSVGLEINEKKTETLIINAPEDVTNLQIDGRDIAIVKDFKYLGAYVGSTANDIKHRIALAWVAFDKLKGILRSPKPSLQRIKMRLFKAACVSTLLYGCETWVLTEAQSEQLDIFARTCYRIMLGIYQAEVHMTNEELYKRAGEKPISTTIRERQLQFVGHCLRMPSNEPANIFAIYSHSGRPLPTGRPCKRYIEQISNHIWPGETTIDVNQITRWAKDKTQWAGIISGNKKPKKPPD
jgi:hypothetical protein